VILDLKLPDFDGLGVLAGLRQQGVTVPVLVLSGRAHVIETVRGAGYRLRIDGR
jgi:DNA-binding response OmpR family regulator